MIEVRSFVHQSSSCLTKLLCSTCSLLGLHFLNLVVFNPLIYLAFLASENFNGPFWMFALVNTNTTKIAKVVRGFGTRKKGKKVGDLFNYLRVILVH